MNKFKVGQFYKINKARSTDNRRIIIDVFIIIRCLSISDRYGRFVFILSDFNEHPVGDVVDINIASFFSENMVEYKFEDDKNIT